MMSAERLSGELRRRLNIVGYVVLCGVIAFVVWTIEQDRARDDYRFCQNTVDARMATRQAVIDQAQVLVAAANANRDPNDPRLDTPEERARRERQIADYLERVRNTAARIKIPTCGDPP